MPWQLSNNNSIYLSIKVVNPAPASQYQFWHFVYTLSLHLGKRRWASLKQKTSSCGPVISWSMAQVNAGQMEQQNQLIFVTAVWQIKSSVLMCSLGGTDCFLSEWCFNENILGFPVFWYFWDWFRAQPVIWALAKKTGIKYQPCRQLISFLSEGLALSKRTWKKKKKKVNFSTLGVSLGYGCDSLRRTFQFPLQDYLVISGLHINVQLKEMYSPTSCSLASM